MTPERHFILGADTKGMPTEHGLLNINGPSVVRTPAWMPDPPGRYLLFFAHHIGESIRLASADEITGPWQVVDNDVINVADTPSDGAAHVASPDVHLDERNERFVMYLHGTVPASVGDHLPCWGVYPTMNQKSMVATSDSGRHFTLVEPIIGVAPSYLRMFNCVDAWFGVAMPSQIVRSQDGLRDFEYGRSLFDDDEIRHCGLRYHADSDQLDVLFTRAGEAPERIYRCEVDVSGDWTDWTPGTPIEVMRPVHPWEGADMPTEPTPRGPAFSMQNGLRDPYILDDPSGAWLFYAAAGENALGVTPLTA